MIDTESYASDDCLYTSYQTEALVMEAIANIPQGGTM